MMLVKKGTLMSGFEKKAFHRTDGRFNESRTKGREFREEEMGRRERMDIYLIPTLTVRVPIQTCFTSKPPTAY